MLGVGVSVGEGLSLGVGVSVGKGPMLGVGISVGNGVGEGTSWAAAGLGTARTISINTKGTA
jgi:hypothetical protein